MNRFDDIRTWAAARNLIEGSDPKSQMLKLAEEMGELAGAIGKSRMDEIIDSIGDMAVVMTIISAQYGYDIEHCIESAYEQIKNRKGKMINGVFVKSEDLQNVEI